MPDNPIGTIGHALGGAIGDVAGAAFDSAMQSLWDFSLSLLSGVFGVIDHLTTPDLNPQSGPLSSVLPATLWIGGVLLLLLSFVQVGKAAISGGAGLVHLFKGIAQYVVVTAAGLGLLAAAVTAANAAALGILSTGLHVSSWSGITASNTAWQNATHAVSGAGLGLIALLGVLPAAISLLLAVLVREAAILVIAATIPIVAAGLVAEATARWFWTATRWLLALVLLTPVVAIVMSLGMHLAAGAAGHTTAAPTADAGQSAVTAFVGAGVLLVSVFCPLALFKLLAFVDPGTASGQRLRTSLADNGSGASSVMGGKAASAGSTSQEEATSEQVETRWHQAVGKVSAAHAAMGSAAQRTMSTAAPILAAVGVGDGLDHDGTGGSRNQNQNQSQTSQSRSQSRDTTGKDSGGDTSTPAATSTPAETDAPTARPPIPPDVDPPAQAPGMPGGGGAPGDGSGPGATPGGSSGAGGGAAPAGGAAGGSGAAAAGAAAL